VTSNYGLPVENIDFIQNKNTVFNGNRDGIDSLNRFLRKNELVSDENFQQVARWIDLESYSDYLVTQLFFANRDWPGNNQKFWRDRVNGSKWRWILYDLDYTMGIYKFDPSIDMFSFSTAPDLDEWPNPSWATLLIRRLLENEAFRDQFVQKYLIHLNTTFEPERVNQVIDSFYYRLYDVFPAHIERWGRPRSMEDWTEWVDLLRLFASERPAYVRQNMKSFFSLDDEIRLTVEVPDHTGQVRANGVLLPESGMHGTYASGLDLNLEFLPAPGYSLKAWELISTKSADTLVFKDPELSIRLYEDTYIRSIAGEPEIDPYTSLYINEFMASNRDVLKDGYGEYDDWIELYNAGEDKVDVAGLYLTDDLNKPAKSRIPPGYAEFTTIEPGDHLVLFADKDTQQGPLHLNFKLSSLGESIGLAARSGDTFTWLDSIHFGPQVPNSSFGRFPDGQREWMTLNPVTPRQSNRIDHISVETITLVQWSVFPNPTSDWLHVSVGMDSNQKVSPVLISLWDLTGRRLMVRSIHPGQGPDQLQLDLSGLTSGVYILTLETGSGMLSKKILKSGR